MKKIIVFTGILMALAVGWSLRAQTILTMPSQMAVSGPHTSCAVVANQTNFCFGTDGLWVSLNGAAYVQLGAQGPAGPAGPAGPTGPQGPPGTSGTGTVTSVNGKTGTVILAIQ